MSVCYTKLLVIILVVSSSFGYGFSQNVGIGVAVPLQKLHVQANGATDGIRIDNIAANGDPVVIFSVNGTDRISMGIDDSDADKFKIGTTDIATSTRLTIQTNGYIGIGTTTPANHLNVLANRAGDYAAAFENSNATGAALEGYVTGTYNALGGVTNNAGGLGSYGVHLPATGGGLAVWGTSNSSDAIGVQGSIPTTGSWLGYGGLFGGGLGYVNGLYNLSDARMKGEVQNLENSLAKLMQIRGVSYKYNSEAYNRLMPPDERTYLGLIAQEVAAVFPEATAQKYLVGTGGKPAGRVADMSQVEREIVTVVDYTSLVPVLIEAIKEQQQQIETLKNRISELEN